MFVGRKNELGVLEDTYKKPGFQMTVIYGRRRIGKTRLIISNLLSLFRSTMPKRRRSYMELPAESLNI